jgi:hypothetical protein
MLWRGHVNQGRTQPGRRAVLEENNCSSDLTNYTARTLFSQAKDGFQFGIISIIFSYLG